MRSSTSTRPRTHWAKSIVAVAGAALLALGMGIAPAQAADTDPITMPDPKLLECINTALGQGATATITEAQAATVTTVDCQSGWGITDLTGMEHFTSVESVSLNNNGGVDDLTPLANLTTMRELNLNFTGVDDSDLASLAKLTDLEILALWGNGLSDLSELADLTSLTVLWLNGNEITDISPLAGLTNMKHLNLEENQITDISPLAGLTNLETSDLDDQSLVMPSAPMNSPTDNPVVDMAGNPVPVTSSGTGYSYDTATETWSFTDRGNKTLAWNTPVTIGSATAVFSGTIEQRISFAQAVPEDPTVTQAVCMNGDVVYPQISLPETEGITYTIVGDVAPGETVTIEAVPADDDHAIYVDPESDWVDASGDHIYATLEVVLDNVDCDDVAPEPTVIDAPNGDLPVDDPCGPDNATWVLPTGEEAPNNFTWVVTADGLLTAIANDGYVFSDPSGDMDPNLREYGYAPDTNEQCASNIITPDGDDAVPVGDGVSTPVGDEPLAATGSSEASGAIAAGLLLGISGLLLLLRRTRRQHA